MGRTISRVFEIGRTYAKAEKNAAPGSVQGYLEKKKLADLHFGTEKARLAGTPTDRKVDIYDIKGVVEGLLNKILLDKFQFICYDSRSALTEETIAVEKNGTYIGFLGKVKRDLLKKFSVESDVYVSELSIEELIQEEEGFRSYVPSSKFPSVTRDLAFIVDTECSGGERRQGDSIERRTIVEKKHALRYF